MATSHPISAHFSSHINKVVPRKGGKQSAEETKIFLLEETQYNERARCPGSDYAWTQIWPIHGSITGGDGSDDLLGLFSDGIWKMVQDLLVTQQGY